MATAAPAQRITVNFSGGYVIGPRATIQKVLGSLESRWSAQGGITLTGRKRRYGSRQRSQALAGEPMVMNFTDGTSFTLRVVGDHVDFINAVLAGPNESQVQSIVSQRGTIYAQRITAS
jgi:hypothetical protein